MKGGPVRALQAEVAGLEAEVKALREGLHAFRAHLHSDKFAGVEKDWINTADVLNWLRELEGQASNARESIVTCSQCGAVMKLVGTILECRVCNPQKRP